MHRDQKIGLSLAVLVIGFSGAFCFRHEPVTAPAALSLPDAAAIDARIQQLPIRAYTQVEGVGGEAGSDAASATEAAVIRPALVEEPAAPLQIDGDAPGDLIELFPSPPEPLAADTIQEPDIEETTLQQTKTVLPPQTPSASRHADPAPRSTSEPTPEPDDAQPSRSTAEVRTYVVQSGDTLSGISLKMYHTSGRWLDIYQANKDSLRSPNDLRPGVTLRIP